MENATLTQVLGTLQHCHHRGITFIEGSAEERFVSYAEFYRRALAAAFQLRQRGVAAGHEVVLQAEDNFSFLVVFWACILSKAVPVPLSVGKQTDHKRKLLAVWRKLTRPHLVIEGEWQDRLALFLREEEPGGACDDLLAGAIPVADLLAAGEMMLPAAVEAHELAYVQFSSGSTGDAKGVCLTHENLVSNAGDIVRRSRSAPGDAMLSWMPLTHDMGMICFHLTGVLAGINQFLMPTSLFIKRPVLWLEKAHEHRITQLYSPNFGLQYFLAALGTETPGWNLSRVRLIYNGAEPISPQVCRDFSTRLAGCGLSPHAMYPGYGLAEASVAVSLPGPGEPWQVHCLERDSLRVEEPVRPASGETAPGAVAFVELGFPVDACRVRIAGRQDQPLAENVLGRVQISGSNVTRGYYNEATKTRDLFTADGWTRTGDLGFLTNGRLVITGREKNMIIVNGQNFYPQDVERVAQRAVPAVRDKVFACGVRDKDSQAEELMLFVLYKGALPAFVPLVKALTAGVARDLGLPLRKIVPIRKLPKTTSGKTQYFQLAEAYRQGEFDDPLRTLAGLLDQQLQQALADAGSPLAKLVHLVQELFPIAPITPGTDLKTLGLNSLTATQLGSRIAAHLMREVPVKALFDAPDVAALARLIEAGEAAGRPALVAPGLPADHYPLTPQQRKFWVLEQLHPGRGQHLITLSRRLRGPVETPVLEAALRALVERQHALRTRFYTLDGQPRQQVVPAAAVPNVFYCEDWRDRPVDPGVEADPGELLDLGSGAPFRVVLRRTGEAEFILMFAIHHIVADGWSVHVLFRELGGLYNALHGGQPFAPAPLALPYPQFARGYVEALEGGRLSGHRDYWLRELGGELPPATLPFADHPLAPLSGVGRPVTFSFSAEVSGRLALLTGEANATYFAGLLALVNLLLYKYSGGCHQRIGTAVAGRVYPEWEAPVGLYANTLCIGSRIAPESDFSALIHQVQAKLWEAFAHQLYPFDALPADLHLPQDWTRTPLFQVLVIFQNMDEADPVAALDPHLEVESLPAGPSPALVELQFEFTRRNGVLSCTITGDAALFASDTVEALAGHLQQLAQTATGEARVPLQACTLLTSGDRQALLGFNRPAVQRSPTTVCELFERAAAAGPERRAVVCGSEVLSYQNLLDQANDVAAALRAAGVRGGDKVGLLVGRSARMVGLLLGVLKTGAALVPVDPSYPGARAAFILEHSGVRCLIADAGVEHPVPGLPVLPAGELTAPAGRTGSRATVSPRDLAYVLYTSGTTGQPKGVMVTHHALVDYVQTFAGHFAIAPGDVVLQQSSLSFDTFVEEVFPTLAAGATLVVAEKGGQDPDQLRTLIGQHGATVLSTTPGVLRELNPWGHALGSIRLVISGGDYLTADCIDGFLPKARVYNTYGPTEATVCAAYHRVTDPAESALIGRPIDNKRIYILNQALELVPMGTAGELFIAGPGIAAGYLGQPGLTAERYLADPLVPGERMYRTGDRGKWLPDGRVQLLGRADNQLKINGYRIEPAEVEHALAAFGGIGESAVISLAGAGETPLLAAYFVAPAPVDEARLRAFLMDRLPPYMVPACLVQLPALPYTVNGKKDTARLPRPVPRQAPAARRLTAPEVQLLAIWREVLGKVTLGPDDDFFAVGGNSIKATRIINHVRDTMGVDAQLRTILLHPTVAAMSRVLPPVARAGLPSIALLPARPHYALSHAQQRLWLQHQYEQEQTTYNMTWAFDLHGPLDAGKLVRALRLLVQRHESFRTVFPVVDGKPAQRIVADAAGAVETLDLSDTGDPGGAAHAVAAREAATPFDLVQGPLFRAKLMQTGPGAHVLLVHMHHIVADGWSLSVFVRELNQLYRSDRPEEALPPLPVQYKDYAAWHNTLLEKGRLDHHRAYWHHQLAGPLPVLNLPQDFARPAVRTYKGETRAYVLDPDNTRFLTGYGREHRVGTFAVLLSLIKALFFQFTAEEDMIVGIPVAGREHADLAGQVGFYVNTLAIRNRVNGEEDFLTLVQRVNATLVQAYEHQLYPFDRLVDELGARTHAGRSPLFDVMVILQNNDPAVLHLGGVAVQARSLARHGSKFDLLFDVTEEDESLRVDIEFNMDLFRPERINRLFGSLEKLLESIRCTPGAALEDLSPTPACQPAVLAG